MDVNSISGCFGAVDAGFIFIFCYCCGCEVLGLKDKTAVDLKTTVWGFWSLVLLTGNLLTTFSLGLLGRGAVKMEEEMQGLRDLVTQLKADNERLRQERGIMGIEPSASTSTAILDGSAPPVQSASCGPLVERLVFVPRDRKCPMFGGGPGIGIEEWEEEVRACMRARHLSRADQAFFIFDHLEREAREEIKYRSLAEREDPEKVLAILRDLYGCSQSYVALQEAFFSRKQQDGEGLLEFSLALMNLMGRVKQAAPHVISNAEVMLQDQFIEHVYDGSLRRELRQLVRRQPAVTLLEVRGEALRWEREGIPGSVRGRSHSVPTVYGHQYKVQGGHRPVFNASSVSELAELKDILKHQQDQLTQLTQSIASLQEGQRRGGSLHDGTVICRSHFARECDGERVPVRPRSASVVPSSGEANRPLSSTQGSEN